jgi:hypothetical protein
MSSDDAGENLANMTELSNSMVGVATLANASVEQFGEAFMRAGARIRMVGVPLNEAAAVLGAFADQGTKGAAGGEALNIILRDLPRAADRNADAFRSLGIRVEEADGTFRPMADIIQDFEGALDGLSATQQANVFTTLGLTRSVADQLSVLVGTSEQIRQYEEDLRLMGDVTQEVADKQMQSFSNQLALTRAQFTNIALTIGEALAGPLRKFNLWLREQTPAIEAWVENAIPAIEKWFVQTNEKFQNFKTSFQTNVIEPLNEFLARDTTIAFFDEFEAEFERFTERLRNLGADLKAAIDAEDPQAIGMVLGEFVAEIFRTAFGRSEVIGEAIKEAFGGQDWTEIGKIVGAVATDFVKGFVIGLFSKPDEAKSEMEQQSRTLTAMFTENFTSTVIGALIVSKLPIIGAPVRFLLRPIGRGFAFLAAKIPPVAGSHLLGALWGVIKGAFLALRFLLLGAGALFGTFIATPLATAIRAGVAALPGLIAPVWQRLLIAVRGQFSAWAFRFAGVAGATISQAIRVLAGVAVRALGRAVAGMLIAIFGWPAFLIGAAVAAIAIFITRFRRWFNDQEGEFENIGSAIGTFIIQGVQAMASWFNDKIIGWFRDRFQAFSDYIDERTGDYENLGSAIIDGMIQGIKNGAIKLKNALVNAARDAWQATKDFFQSRSPSMLFAGLGGDLMLGMAQGIDRSARVVTDAMRDVSVDTAGVRFDAPQVPSVSRDGSGQQPIIINVSGALDAEGVARQIERILRDSKRRTGGVLV